MARIFYTWKMLEQKKKTAKDIKYNYHNNKKNLFLLQNSSRLKV